MSSNNAQRKQRRRNRERISMGEDDSLAIKDVFSMNRKERRAYLSHYREQLRKRAKKEERSKQ